MSGLFGNNGRATRGPACPVCNAPKRKFSDKLFHARKLECEPFDSLRSLRAFSPAVACHERIFGSPQASRR